MKPIIAITMGDAAGIGPEVCLRAVASNKLTSCYPVIVGSADVLDEMMHSLKIKMTLNRVKSPEESQFRGKTINVLDSGGIRLKNLILGKVSPMCGLASINYVRIAAKLAVERRVDAITTAPINKQAVHIAKLSYKGHTELLSEIFHTKVVMIFVSRKVCIAIVTRHLPISRVSAAITRKTILETIKIIYDARNILGLQEPSFAVLSLNPHGGEGGVLGNDEERKIMPAIREAKKLGINVNGPFPSDGFFGAEKQKHFNIVIAMYHDQGLIPYKITSFGQGVNVTLGLPIIRTSVDHGTAYDIAAKKTANPSALIEAVRLASVMARRRASE